MADNSINPPVKTVLVYPDSVPPKRAKKSDSGMDLTAHHFISVFKGTKETKLGENCTSLSLYPGHRTLVDTGIKATVGDGYEIQIRPRSGLACKKGLTVLNTPGTVDASYRGHLGVILINTTDETLTLEKGERIAQMVVSPVVLSEVLIVEDLDETDRNDGGFGHTGV